MRDRNILSPSKIKKLQHTSIDKLLKNYDHFIIDVYGVIYDGREAYPRVTETLKALKNKDFIFLSNAPRPSQIVIDKLDGIGITIEPRNIITSGDFFIQEVATLEEFKGRKFFVIGEDQNEDLLKHLKIKRTSKLSEAEYVIFLMFEDDIESVSKYDEVFQNIVHNNITVLCPNPDKIVMMGDEFRYTGGTFAKKVEDLGGTVRYFGKPYEPIYSHIINKNNFDKSRTLAIGDAFETDIKGAVEVGIDSALVRTGIHSHEKDIEKLIKMYNVAPTYTINSFGIEHGE